ncbi:MAG: viperin family antiviral radical SAM protein [Candidatus Izemoplasmatales bacterium]
MGQYPFHVFNFHLTEKCNYQCKYCFAKFNNQSELNLKQWKEAVDLTNQYFIRNNIRNGRINLAGGEPLILPFLDELIDYIHSLDIIVSIITNASLLTEEKIQKWIGKVDTIGVSIDSINYKTNLKIGRHNNGQVIDVENIISLLQLAKKNNIKVKINTVVSALNINERIDQIYKRVQPDRIKILQMRVNQNCNEHSIMLQTSDEDFHKHCRYLNNYQNVVIENSQELECSYLIVDSMGNMLSNKNNVQNIVGNILKDDIEKMIDAAEINHFTYAKRY